MLFHNSWELQSGSKVNKLKTYRKIGSRKSNKKGIKKGIFFNLTTLTKITAITLYIFTFLLFKKYFVSKFGYLIKYIFN